MQYIQDLEKREGRLTGTTAMTAQPSIFLKLRFSYFIDNVSPIPFQEWVGISTHDTIEILYYSKADKLPIRTYAKQHPTMESTKLLEQSKEVPEKAEDTHPSEAQQRTQTKPSAPTEQQK